MLIHTPHPAKTYAIFLDMKIKKTCSLLLACMLAANAAIAMTPFEMTTQINNKSQQDISYTISKTGIDGNCQFSPSTTGGNLKPSSNVKLTTTGKLPLLNNLNICHMSAVVTLQVNGQVQGKYYFSVLKASRYGTWEYRCCQAFKQNGNITPAVQWIWPSNSNGGSFCVPASKSAGKIMCPTGDFYLTALPNSQ